MKLAVLFTLALTTAMTFMAPQAFGGETKTCKVSMHDIGRTIVGRGKTAEAAFEDAAIQCFESRAQLHSMKRNTDFDEDTGLLVIDLCANIKCG